MKREFLDPEYETPVVAYETPHEREGGGASRRLKSVVFESGETGALIVACVVHRTFRLSALSEPELEALYLTALEADE